MPSEIITIHVTAKDKLDKSLSTCDQHDGRTDVSEEIESAEMKAEGVGTGLGPPHLSFESSLCLTG